MITIQSFLLGSIPLLGWIERFQDGRSVNTTIHIQESSFAAGAARSVSWLQRPQKPHLKNLNLDSRQWIWIWVHPYSDSRCLDSDLDSGSRLLDSHITDRYCQSNVAHLDGNSQLILGMADFSQGIFLQSVGWVKKKKRAKGYKPTPNNTRHIAQNIIIMVPIERNGILHPILSGYTCPRGANRTKDMALEIFCNFLPIFFFHRSFF